MRQIEDDTQATCIGVAVNNSAASAAALSWACDEAGRVGADLVVASVVRRTAAADTSRSRDEAREAGDEVVARIVTRCPATDFRVHVVDADAADIARSIASALARCDLLVIGSPESPDHRMLAFEIARLTASRVIEVDPDGVALPVQSDGLLLGR